MIVRAAEDKKENDEKDRKQVSDFPSIERKVVS